MSGDDAPQGPATAGRPDNPYRRGHEAGLSRGSELGYEAGYRAGGEVTHIDMRQPDETGNVEALLSYADGFRDGCLQTVAQGFEEGWEAACRDLPRNA